MRWLLAAVLWGRSFTPAAQDPSQVFNTAGFFRTIMPMDGSAYDRLRIDVHGRESELTLRVQIEDEEIAPPIVRNITVKPEQGCTVEIDLRAAEKARKLDLKRIATLSAAVVKTEKLKPSALAFIENIRLSSSDAPAKHAIVRDDSAPDSLQGEPRHPVVAARRERRVVRAAGAGSGRNPHHGNGCPQ